MHVAQAWMSPATDESNTFPSARHIAMSLLRPKASGLHLKGTVNAALSARRRRSLRLLYLTWVLVPTSDAARLHAHWSKADEDTSAASRATETLQLGPDCRPTRLACECRLACCHLLSELVNALDDPSHAIIRCEPLLPSHLCFAFCAAAFEGGLFQSKNVTGQLWSDPSLSS